MRQDKTIKIRCIICYNVIYWPVTEKKKIHFRFFAVLSFSQGHKTREGLKDHQPITLLSMAVVGCSRTVGRNFLPSPSGKKKYAWIHDYSWLLLDFRDSRDCFGGGGVRSSFLEESSLGILGSLVVWSLEIDRFLLMLQMGSDRTYVWMVFNSSPLPTTIQETRRQRERGWWSDEEEDEDMNERDEEVFILESIMKFWKFNRIYPDFVSSCNSRSHRWWLSTTNFS